MERAFSVNLQRCIENLEVKDWEVIGEGFGHRKGANSLLCSPQTGDYPYNTLGMLISSSNDGYMYFWDVRALIFHRTSVHASLRMKYFPYDC